MSSNLLFQLKRGLFVALLFHFWGTIAAQGQTQGLLPIRQNGKWGLINRQGRLVLPPHFDAVGDYHNGAAIVVRNGRYGAVDSAGNIFIETQYDFLQHRPDGFWQANRGGQPAGTECKNGLWGLLRPDGSAFLPFEFQKIGLLDNGFFVVNRGGKPNGQRIEGGSWGAANRKGVLVLPAEFEAIKVVDSLQVMVKKNSGWGLYHVFSGQTSPLVFDYIERGSPFGTIVRKDSLYGWLDPQGALKVPLQFHRLEVFYAYGQYILPVKKDSLWGLYYGDGRQIAAPQYDSLAVWGKKMNLKNNPVFSSFISDLWENSPTDGAILLKNAQGWLAADTAGQIKPTAAYQKIEPLQGGYFLASDAKGKTVLSPAFEPLFRGSITGAYVYPTYQSIVLQNKQSQGLIDTKGNKILPLEFDQLLPKSENLVFGRQGQYWKLYADKGRQLKLDSLSQPRQFYQNKSIVVKDGNYALIDSAGNFILPFKKTVLEFFGEGVLSVFDGMNREFYDVNELNSANDEPTGILMVKRGSVNSSFGPNLTGRGITAPNVQPQPKNFPYYWSFARAGVWRLRRVKDNHAMPVYANEISYCNKGRFTLFGLRTQSLSETAAPTLIYGLVDLQTGRILVQPRYKLSAFHTEDFDSAAVMRLCMADKALKTIDGEAVYPDARYQLINRWGKVLDVKEFTQIGSFSGGRAKFCRGGSPALRYVRKGDQNESLYQVVHYNGGKWGFIDTLGRVVIQPKYEDASYFMGRSALVKDKGKWGMIDAAEKWLIEPRYDKIEFIQGLPLAQTETKVQKFGFINAEGKPVAAAFDKAGAFANGLAPVKIDKLWGFMNANGTLAIAAQFEDAAPFSEGLAAVRSQKMWGYIDVSGQWVVQPVYRMAKPFANGRAAVRRGTGWGYINRKGQETTPFRNALADTFCAAGVARVKESGLFGLIDSVGGYVLPPKYVFLSPPDSGFVTASANGKAYLFNLKGEKITRKAYFAIGKPSCGRVRVRENGLWGYIDLKGQVVTPIKLTQAADYKEGFALVRFKGDKYAQYIDRNGKGVGQTRSILFLRSGGFSEGLARYFDGRVYRFLNAEGETPFLNEFVKARDFCQGLAAVYVDSANIDGQVYRKKWGFIDANGQWAVKPRYDETKDFAPQGIAAVKTAKGWGLVNAMGAEVTTPKYKTAPEFKNGLAPVLLEKYLGVCNLSGNILFENAFDYLQPFGRQLQVQANGQIGYLDRNGQWIYAIETLKAPASLPFKTNE